MISRFFIDRPIFAAVISIFLVLAGLAAMRTLPVAQYPEIAPPVVTVQAIYPGASAQVVEQTVAAPLENAINGIAGMMYMSSNSASNGVVQIQVTFEIGTDIDIAAVNVNNRVKQVEPRLPEEVRRQGVTVERGSSSFLQVVAFYSPDNRYNDLFTSNYVTLNVLDEIKRLPGTTNVQIFGAKDYAMRIWLKPDRLAQLKMSPSDVIAAVNEQNAQFAAGKVGQAPISKGQDLVFTVTTKGRLSDPKEFEQIIVRANPDGSTVRLGDVARVELGSKDYEFNGRYNGKPATLVGIFLSPGANALDVAKASNRLLADLSTRFPEGLSYRVAFDTTRFVEVSIREVLITLGEAMVLVFLVVYLFLQSWRAAIIPFAAVPVALIGTFAGISLLGYSINTLTLFAMVLSIGIVVDDAIVVLENVERIMREDGLAARDAAVKAMKEVTGPIIAIVLTLVAVFVPIAFLGGLTGELYRQFAVTISISVVISGVVALTLSPALCALILKPHVEARGFFRWFNHWFERVVNRYSHGVAFLIRHGIVALTLFALMVGGAMLMWRITPGSLVPDEDQGFYISAVILPDGATLERTQKVVDAGRGGDPQQSRTTRTSSRSPASTSSAAASATTPRRCSSRKSRGTTARSPRSSSWASCSPRPAHIKEALVLAFNPPPIFGLGTTGGYEFYIQNRGDGGSARLSEVKDAFLARVNADPELGGAQTLWHAAVPQLFVDVDREKAKKMGVPINDIFATLSATMGTYYVNDFNKYGRTWQVLMSAEPQFRKKPDDITGVYVRSRTGDMVPLSSLVTVKYIVRSRLARPLQQPAGGEDHRPGGARATARARRSRASSRSRAKCCRRISATTGAARRTRRRNRAARRRSRSASPSIMVFLILVGAVRDAGRCRSPCCWRCRSAPSARWSRCGRGT